MSIGLIFVVVLAFILVGSMLRKDRHGKPPDRKGGYDPSMFALSNPDLIESPQDGSPSSPNDSHGRNHQHHHGGADSNDGRQHSGFHDHGHSGGTHGSGGFGDFGGHSHGGHSSGGDYGGGGDCSGGGDCGGGGGGGD